MNRRTRFVVPHGARPNFRSAARHRLRFDTLEDRTAPAIGLPEGFVSTNITSALSWPTAMEVAPDGRIFVTEKGGALRVIEDGNLLPTPFVTMGVDAAGEKGLLGVAFDPDFASNHFVYIYYTTPATTSPAVEAHNRVSRFDASGNTASGPEQILVDLDPLGGHHHNAGAIHFGNDGKLYVATGDNGFPSLAQSLDSRLGKILRYNPDGTIPADNPTSFDGVSGTTSGANQAIYAIGFRNPFTFAVQPGGSTIYVNDVGDRAFEEINALAPGANYGWPVAEGPSDNPDFTNPVLAYPHGGGFTAGFCIAGGAFYSSPSASFPPDFAGDYFFADFTNGWIRHLDAVDGSANTFASGIANPVDLKVDGGGNLLYLTVFGQLESISFESTQRQRFIQTTYGDVLGRAASFAEVNTWAAEISSGGPSVVAAGIARSDEALGRVVDGIYSYMLGRAPDAEGRATHVRFLSAGNSVELTLANFAASDEFAERAASGFRGGDSNADFIRALYDVFLDRAATEGEVEFWLLRLPSLGRTGLALNFTGSAEYRANTIAGFYGPSAPPPFFVTVLDRTEPPAVSEILGWVASDLDLLAIEQAFLSSDEYFNKS